MATNHQHGNDDAGNASVTYDRSDLGARGILIFFLVLAVFAVCIHLAVLGMWVGLSKVADKHDPELSPLAPRTVTPRVGVLMNTANINVQPNATVGSRYVTVTTNGQVLTLSGGTSQAGAARRRSRADWRIDEVLARIATLVRR